MLEKFAEDDRIEQMNAQKRRMKQLEHKKAVEKLIEDRRIQFQRERVRRHVSSKCSRYVVLLYTNEIPNELSREKMFLHTWRS